MNKDSYEFVPTDEINKLEHDLEHLKENPFVGKAKGKELSHSVTELQKEVTQLLHMFKQAHEELTLEQREAKVLQEQLQPLVDKIQEVADQNETIANGILAVSDAVEHITDAVGELKQKITTMEHKMELHSHSTSTPMQAMQQPQMTPPPTMPNMPYNTQQGPTNAIPPIEPNGFSSNPPSAPEKKTQGSFGSLFKK